MKESINRAKETGYVKYMMANPIYFEDISKKEATLGNVVNEYRMLECKGMVASSAVSPHCSCSICAAHRKYRRRK